MLSRWGIRVGAMRRAGVFACVMLLVAGGVWGLRAASASPVTTGVGAWTATADGPQRYTAVHVDWDVPIRMSDGIVLKANIYRPMDAAGHIVSDPLPTIVNLTPYTKLVTNLIDSAMAIPKLQPLALELARSIDLTGTPISGFGDLVHAINGGAISIFGVDRNLIRSGYTMVVADVRGTGFSQGDWQTLCAREQLDTREVIDWAAGQPWSDGKVGMSGMSYSGINQLQAAENAPAPLKAIFPVEPGSDLVRDVVAPGGGLGTTFMPLWLSLVNVLKLVPDVRSMLTGTFDWKWLADRVADPLTMFDALLAALTVPTVDAVPPTLATLLRSDSPFREGVTGHPERITVPAFVYDGWHDIFANSAANIYNAIPLPAGDKQLLMGDTYHMSPGSGTGMPGGPPRLDVLQRAWFDHWLKGVDNGITSYGPVTMRQQGGGWVTSTRFPEPGIEYRRVYLSAAPSGTASGTIHDGSLTPTVPGRDRLTIAPGLTNICSRDAAQGSMGITAVLDVCAKDNRVAETNGLTFTSPPVTTSTVISGPISIHLNTVQDALDGYWDVTVDDVAPDGTSTVLTTGQLTASLRAVDQSKSLRSPNGDYTQPYNDLTLATLRPAIPGQPTPLDIAIIPTDAVLQPAHRLRIDIFAGNFPKSLALRPLLNNTQLAPQHLDLDPTSPSFVNLPTTTPIP
ncbi:CocE/NonD family hydrolase [Nocardia macrotermitis]|uniref:Putative serine esterase n=1 Tax=Nocardia macrotermitis TaxID=2585198 RepID=A0A7K0CU08_9NOCA|nr:CocE/NonD family hydrolase [Nocardia macrotermitis]MQY16960.1 putative serine esterase [Nocardia macrotermitis]